MKAGRRFRFERLRRSRKTRSQHHRLSPFANDAKGRGTACVVTSPRSKAWASRVFSLNVLLRLDARQPQGLKPNIHCGGPGGTTERFAEKLAFPELGAKAHQKR